MSFEFRAALPPDIDTTLFAWQRITRESVLPPTAVCVEGRHYLVSGFGRITEGCLLKNLETMRDALTFSISLNGAPTIGELAAIAKIAEKLNVDISSIAAFDKSGIKGNKNIETLKKTATLPENILKYLDERPLPLRTLSLLTSFENDAIEFIATFIDKNRPSVQALKIFIESTSDFREELKACGYDENFAFPDRRCDVHQEIDDALKKLSAKAAPVKIIQPDNFETGRLIFSFEANDFESYAKCAPKLEDIKDDMARFCALMKKHDIY